MSVLRKLFGPSKKEVWQQLAEATGGEFVAGSFLKAQKVVVRVKDWTITLDTFAVSNGKTTTVYTRMRAPYVNKDGFRFTISRSNFFSELGRKMGMQDIEIGDAQFDREFVVKSNQPEKIRQLLSYPKLRELLQAQPRVSLSVKDDEGWFGSDFPEGVDELYFVAPGVMKNLDQLQDLFMLFAVTLNYLCHQGSAYEDDPQVQVK